MYREFPKKRYRKTLEILKKYAKEQDVILDLGVENPFSKIMKDHGWQVINTTGQDLDLNYIWAENQKFDFVTALEIIEHLVNPFEVLRNLPAEKALITVPLRLWFSPCYRNINDPRDCHFHEFEPWQLDFLLEKAGWEIIYREKWTHPVRKIGLRPLLRLFTNRYYAVVVKRKRDNFL